VDALAEVEASGQHFAEGGDDLRRGCLLRNKTFGPRAQDSFRVVLFRVHREHEHGEWQFLRGQVLDQIESVRSRQREINDRGIGTGLLDERQRILDVIRLAAHRQARLLLDELHEHGPEERVVFHD
jgi:hypothetical protein